MVRKSGYLALAFALLACAPLVSAGEILVELRAQGAYVDPHNITVNVGDTVALEYVVSGIGDLTGWQDEFYISGPATELGVVSGASWWETASGNTALATSIPGVGRLRVLGLTNLGPTSSPPYAYTPDALGSSLVVMEFECLGIGDVTVNAFLRPEFLPGDPGNGQIIPPPFTISDGSNPVVVIHQSDDGQPREWNFEYEVNDALLGQITGTAEGLYPDNTLMDIIASPLDPTSVKFLNWELLSDVPGFPGDLSQPDLGGPFPLTANVSLLANFGVIVIPEPATLAVLCGGLAFLSRRRRR